MLQRWPERLYIVRHGESAGNVARNAAHAARATHIQLNHRDVDVPLSDLGHRQAVALGHWFARMGPHARPDVLLVSPYWRAQQTARHIVDVGGLTPGAAQPAADERLREKEFGVVDRLTRWGIERDFPEQAKLRAELGKFYHRPPGGESWCDVILRLRSALDTISMHHGGRRVLVVGHQVVVLCLRYLLENLDEDGILAIDRESDLANCSVTEYAFDPGRSSTGGLVLERYNFTAPMEQEGATVTAAPDVPATTQ